ncbi:MAG: T9SS type A sorting domain-containing protein [Bacteroidetes bacterium]|nr:T9SS type A sorting domain-containing protein [Bacteroidota bacterium]
MALSAILLGAAWGQAAWGQTILTTGDIAIVGVSACPGVNDDQVSFFCFKDITTGTTIDLTDNGYERGTTCSPAQAAGTFGNSEGTVRMTRTGGLIPAGQVITFSMNNTTTVTATAPDANWTCTILHPGGFSIELNNNGDQLIFMQGGTWSPGTTTPTPLHNATYTGGRYLAAISTNSAAPWTAACASPPGPRQSNPPPGVGCLALRVNTATAWDKYIGPITTTTQGGWLLRVSDPTNWQSYASCATYGSAGQNWLLAPTLPITTSTPTNGLWTGAKGTDWFNICNWDDFQVPTAATNALINQTSVSDCVVGTSPVSSATTAVCSSLTIRSNGTARNLTVDNGKILTVGGTTLVQRLNAGSPCGLSVQNSSTFVTGNLTLAGSTPGSAEAFFSNTAALNVVTVNGHLRIEDGGRLALTNGTLRVNGDFTNLNSEARFEDNNSTVVFGGSGTQSITTSGFEEYFHVLRVNKPANDLTLNNGIRIRANLDLLSGRIFENSSLLVMDATATATNTSDNSFVHGAVQKYGTTDFTFPIGKGLKFRPSRLTMIAGTATDAFTSEYFAASPQTTFGNAKEPTLHHISDCEYWTISRSAGSANAYVTLSWDTPASCGVTSNATLSELRIARWDGSLWLDRGEGDYSGNFISGTLITSALQTAFSPWTLASITVNNPLPIQLLGFTATPEGTRVRLRWTTASETDNAFFTVERSADGTTFVPVLHQDGAGTSQGMLQYEGLDEAPLPGLSYYRLRQTDVDGASTVSDAVPVYFGNDAGAPLIVLYAGDGPYAMHGFATGSTLDVIDPTGRLLRRERITNSGLSPLPVDGLTPGAYIVRITDGVRQQSTRFVLPIH